MAYLRVDNDIIVHKSHLNQRLLYDLTQNIIIAEEEEKELQQLMKLDAEKHQEEMLLAAQLKSECDVADKTLEV